MNSPYYYSSSLENFLIAESDSILGSLAENNQFELTIEQKNAWLGQISSLKDNLSDLTEGHLFFEYSIPRMGKRCDVIFIYRDVVYVLEFKVGSDTFTSADVRQAVDYALDLKNFHKESHDCKIIPVLISTNAEDTINTLDFAEDQISNCQLSSGKNLTSIIGSINNDAGHLDPLLWADSSYQPTPTIIEAAKALYKDHSVKSISRSDASAKNLSQTCSCIEDIITHSKKHSQKSICFVTGVPGAGKTLAGLNVATSVMEAGHKEHSTFLSGNGPLVAVLQRALAVDKSDRENISIKAAERETKAFIQNIHHFRDNYLIDQNAPSDQVVIFDEAQRAWTKEKASKFMKAKKGIPDFDQSEPHFLIEVMGRHEDWCVVIALVGGGQEINDGEAGLPEWFKSIHESTHDWHTYYSPHINSPEYLLDHSLDELIPPNSEQKVDLHLSVSLRSFRAEKLSSFINTMISGDHKKAATLSQEVLKNYPIYITSDISAAKKWVSEKNRGNERCGIVASSHAKRLVPYGIQMKLSIEPEHWFLGDPQDIRSSNFMELAASQYDVQGLELDWTIVAWDADLRRERTGWKHYSFKGSKWQNINKPIDQLYLRNAYRVILTRARQGMVFFIPEGDSNDVTRDPEFYQQTRNYLLSCGIPQLTK